MLSGKTMTILLLYEKSFYPEPDSHNRNRIKFELDLSNYETKYYKKKCNGVHTSKLAKMDDLAGVKPKADKLNINELKTVPVDLNK